MILEGSGSINHYDNSLLRCFNKPRNIFLRFSILSHCSLPPAHSTPESLYRPTLWYTIVDMQILTSNTARYPVIAKLLTRLTENPSLVAILLGLSLIALYLAYRLLHCTQITQMMGLAQSLDHSKYKPITKAWFSKRYMLTGKPDGVYVDSRSSRTIPYEFKSTQKPKRGAYDSHLMQLAAYCLLCNEVYEQDTPYGILQYAAAAPTRIPFDKALKKKLLRQLREIDRLKSGRVPAIEPEPARCLRCNVKHQCEFRRDV